MSSHALAITAILAGEFAGMTALVLLAHPPGRRSKQVQAEQESGGGDMPIAA